MNITLVAGRWPRLPSPHARSENADTPSPFVSRELTSSGTGCQLWPATIAGEAVVASYY